MTSKPKNKKHQRIIKAEPANNFQEEMLQEIMDAITTVIRGQFKQGHKKNKITIEYTNDL